MMKKHLFLTFITVLIFAIVFPTAIFAQGEGGSEGFGSESGGPGPSDSSSGSVSEVGYGSEGVFGGYSDPFGGGGFSFNSDCGCGLDTGGYSGFGGFYSPEPVTNPPVGPSMPNGRGQDVSFNTATGNFEVYSPSSQDSPVSRGGGTRITSGGANARGFTGPIHGANFTGNGVSVLTITKGECVTLAWDNSSAGGCTGSGFTVQPSQNLVGSTLVCPNVSTSYTLQCAYGVGDSGDASSYFSYTSSGFVAVFVLDPELSISVSPKNIRSGRQATIEWSATGVDSCTVTGPGGFFQNSKSGSALSGPLTFQSTFILTCKVGNREFSESAVVTIIPAFEEF